MRNKTLSNETKLKISIANKGKSHKGHSINISWTSEKRKERSIKYSKRIINTKTNEIYLNALELSKIINIPSSTISGKMSGRLKNNTDYVYLTDYICKEQAKHILLYETLLPF